MNVIESLLKDAARFLPSIGTLIFFSAPVWWLVSYTNKRQALADYRRTLVPQFLMVAFAVIGLLTFLLTLPFSDTTRGQVVGLAGVMLTGIIAISSTTFVTNAMAGLMLRWIRHFKAGDFIEVKGLFGRITELGDFSVSYKISGFLTESKRLLSARSDLKRNILDVLHQAGIEIVSPNFMNQRVLPEKATIIPQETGARKMPAAARAAAPETVMFDKAESAEEMDHWQKKYDALGRQLEELKKGSDDAGQVQVKLIEEEMVRIKEKMEAYNDALKADEVTEGNESSRTD